MTKEEAGIASRLLEPMVLVARLCEAVGASPLTRWPNGWEHQIDDEWRIIVNGSGQWLRFKSDKEPLGVDIEPFGCYVEYNGWPAGMFNPVAGILAAGEAANEDTFCAAVEAAINREEHKRK